MCGHGWQSETVLQTDRSLESGLTLCTSRSMRRRETTLTLHGLGAAINRCINLALQLEYQAKGAVKVPLRCL